MIHNYTLFPFTSAIIALGFSSEKHEVVDKCYKFFSVELNAKFVRNVSICKILIHRT